MVPEFKYCSNPDAEIPKMFIDKQIGGFNDKGEAGIDGNLFMKELLCLSDELGKRNIEVWINSEGGFVQEGQSIYAGILHSKANVDTICYGLAASIAGVIFQAGRKRKMLDFANLMYHPAYNEDGTEDKGLTAMNDSIAVMVASRTGKQLPEIKALMNAGKPREDKGTWLNASVACQNGFCDEVLKSDETNLKRMASMTTPTAQWQFAQNVLNSIKNELPKIKSMKQVCNKLGLNAEANEDSVVSAIVEMQAKNKNSVDALQAKIDKMEEEMKALKEEKKALQAKNEAAEAAKATADAAAKAEAETTAKALAKTEVTNAVKAGRIKNDAAIISKWENMLVTDFKNTKELIDAMPVSKPSFQNHVSSKAVVGAESTLSAETKAELELNGIVYGSMEYENMISLKAAQAKK